jgi:hypothetical protein
MDDTQWLTRVLAADPIAITRAKNAYHDAGGGEDGVLAARRVLVTVLRVTAGWPRAEDFFRLADGFTQRGDPGMARLLCQVADAGHLLEAAAREWGTRYDDRTTTPQQDLASWLTKRGRIDCDPNGPGLGIDGAYYQAGVVTTPRGNQPVVLVTSRGMHEIIRGWDSYEQMRGWIASRGSTGGGDLTPPAAAQSSRMVREERVLAHLLYHRRTMPEITRFLPAVTFTNDVRYDLYAALVTAARRDAPCTDAAVWQEFTRRLTRVPVAALAGYGGPAGYTADLYRCRLIDTPVSHDEAVTAAISLRDEDRHAVRTRACNDITSTVEPAETAAAETAPAETQRPASRQGPVPPAPRM